MGETQVLLFPKDASPKLALMKCKHCARGRSFLIVPAELALSRERKNFNKGPLKALKCANLEEQTALRSLRAVTPKELRFALSRSNTQKYLPHLQWPATSALARFWRKVGVT